jgi:hypothetical protein
VNARDERASYHFDKRKLEMRVRAITSTSEHRRREGEESLQQVGARDRSTGDWSAEDRSAGDSSVNRGSRRMGEVEEL